MWILRVLIPWVLTGLIFGNIGRVQAQNRSVKNYTTQDGLPSAEVFHILQDSQGFLWFSTSNGIASFDGYQMKAYSVHDGVPDPLVLETQEDNKGRIWMRSLSGRIAYHDSGKIYPFIHNDSLSKFCSKSFLEAFAQDSAGRWVFYESNDSYCVIKDDGSVVRASLKPEWIVITPYGDQLVIQNSIFEKVDSVLINGKVFPITVPPSNPKYDHHHLSAIRWNEQIFFSVRNNLFRFDGTSVKLVMVAHAAIINLSTDQQGGFYVGHMNHGTVRFDNPDLLHGDTLAFTRNQSITDVLEDREGGLWVSTLEAGVFYVPSTGVVHHFLPDNPRIESALVHNGKILIGTYDGLLLSLDEKDKSVRHQQKFDRTILALHAINDTVFAGTSSYLQIIPDMRRSPGRTYKGSVLGFVEREKDVLAISGRTMSSYRKDGFQKKRTRYDRAIRDLYADDSIYYVVPHLGIEICNDSLAVLSRPALLKDFKISQLHSVDDTTLLLGTIGSGLIIANKALTRISIFESLPRDIYSIVKLDANFYFASEQGIFRISSEDLSNRRVRTVLLNGSNGLLNKSINLLKTTSDKKLIVFYDRSFSIVDPAGMSGLNRSPNFYLDAVTVNNQKMKLNTRYDLPYDSNSVQLDFGFVSFNNQDINIRYRLNETDGWTYPARTNSINLYSLSPGSYTLQLEYTADRFTWQQAAALPIFKIRYPWWRNPFLQGIAFIMICVVAFIIVRNRLEIQRERNARLKLLTIQQEQLLAREKLTTDRERNRIAKDLHDSIGSSLLATKLSVSRILKRYNHHEADEIEQQLSNTLNEIKNIIYDLSPTELERDGLSLSVKNYIDKLSGVTDIQLNIVFYGEDITDSRIINPVFRILQELLSNSIKHSAGTAIAVSINSFDELLNIVYEDNGQGFSPVLSMGIGKGLENVAARVETLKGQLKVDSGDYGTSYIIDIPKFASETSL